MGCVGVKFASMCSLNVRISDAALGHAAQNNKFSTHPSLMHLQTVTALLHQWRKAGKKQPPWDGGIITSVHTNLLILLVYVLARFLGPAAYHQRPLLLLPPSCPPPDVYSSEHLPPTPSSSRLCNANWIRRQAAHLQY